MRFSCLIAFITLFIAIFYATPSVVGEETAPTTPAVVENILEERFLSLGLGVGGVASPGMFTLKINADYIIDGIFSLGPYLQGAFARGIQFFVAALDGKFRFSVPGIGPRFKFMTLIGAGYLYRREEGINYADLTGRLGVGGEYFILDFLSVGVEAAANLTSSGRERFFISFFAGANYYL